MNNPFGLIGLAVMGQNLVLNVESRGFAVSVYNRSPEVTESFVAAHPGKRITGTKSLQTFVASLARPRKIMLMVKAGPAVDAVIEQLIPLLDKDDIVIDGGNSLYADTERRDAWLTPLGFRLVGAGVSGGEEGARKGPAIMPGGPASTWNELRPIFEAISAKVGGEPCVTHIGPGGAGHYVKMVHNGIEYGLMAAYAEGFNLLHHANIGAQEVDLDAETTPLREPDAYRFDLDVPEIAELWRRGSVIPSWLLDLTAASLVEAPTLDGFAGRVSDSGEGRWTVLSAVETGVPTPVLSAALYERFASRGRDDFANKVLSAMRYQFGGHHEKTDDGTGVGA